MIDGLFKRRSARPGAGRHDSGLLVGAAVTCVGADELTAFQWLEIQSSLPDELLMYGDKMSMAHGLEVRCRTWIARSSSTRSVFVRI